VNGGYIHEYFLIGKYILSWFFHCTTGCSIILTFIVNDMGSHRLHAYIVSCICSALAWWWLFYGWNI